MKKVNLIVFLTIFFSLVSQAVLAQTTNPFNLGPWNFSPGDLTSWLRLVMGNPPGVPDSWFGLPDFIYFVVFPFIAIVSLLYGLLSEIHLFQSQNVKITLAIAMAAISLPTGWLIVFVYYAFSALSFWAVGVFVVVFFFGILFWGISKGRGIYSDLKPLDTEMGRLRREAGEIQHKWATKGYGDPSNPKNVERYENDLSKNAAKWQQAALRKKELTGQ